ncbi:PAK4-inhibitor INKA2 [Eudromia elegans]
MDLHLRRLRQELLSMKEVGDGLHEQMTCMMGALQELKLLQVQTALEQLELSNCCHEEASPAHGPCSAPGSAEHLCARTLEPGGNRPCSARRERAAGTPGHGQGQGSDDGDDWTSSLMSQSRNRQPLVLGDNVFADLVGNWLDLPELDKKAERSRSQELCRKFSLTANIFKKLLRSVRPDRERLLKEKPCWLPPEDREPEVSKRAAKPGKLKGTFYLPLHGSTPGGRAERHPNTDSSRDKPQSSTKKAQDAVDYPQPGFDINTAVWV